jgi:hypothetical protein
MGCMVVIFSTEILFSLIYLLIWLHSFTYLIYIYNIWFFFLGFWYLIWYLYFQDHYKIDKRKDQERKKLCENDTQCIMMGGTILFLPCMSCYGSSVHHLYIGEWPLCRYATEFSNLFFFFLNKLINLRMNIVFTKWFLFFSLHQRRD